MSINGFARAVGGRRFSKTMTLMNCMMVGVMSCLTSALIAELICGRMNKNESEVLYNVLIR